MKNSLAKITVLMGDPKLADPVKRGGIFNPEDMETIKKLEDTLNDLKNYSFEFLDNHKTLLDDILHKKIDFVFNLCDEGYRNNPKLEMNVPAFLELLEIPYTGASPGCLALCFNKANVRSIASSIGVPVPLEHYSQEGDLGNLKIDYPVLLKPSYGDGSIGITQNAVVNNKKELLAYIKFLKETCKGVPILVQEFLSGNEYSVGLIGNPGAFETLPLLEVDYSNLPKDLPKLLPYESKWHPESPYWNNIKYKEANLDKNTKKIMVEASMDLFERLECRDYARFDWRLNAKGEPKLLEVNPNPGWCWDGKFNLMASFGAIEYSDFLEKILQAALKREGFLSLEKV